MYKKYLFLIVLLSISVVVFCQSELSADPEEPDTVEDITEETGTPVPDGFNEIFLGMEMDTVKDKLKADSNFNFRGDPDVSLLLSPNESLIECTGFSYVDRAFFQFYDKKLYIIILMINKEKMDHYSIYTSFIEKYGEPASLSPSKIIWESDDFRFSLERPLNIKYVDLAVFNTLLLEGKAGESLRILSREQFLDQF